MPNRTPGVKRGSQRSRDHGTTGPRDHRTTGLPDDGTTGPPDRLPCGCAAWSCSPIVLQSCGPAVLWSGGGERNRDAHAGGGGGEGEGIPNHSGHGSKDFGQFGPGPLDGEDLQQGEPNGKEKDCDGNKCAKPKPARSELAANGRRR